MHGLDVDEYGNHIIPKEKSTAELLEEGRKLLQQDKKEPETVAPKPLTKQQQQTEFEKHIEKWRKFYEQNTSKIAGFPKTIFDKII